MAAQTSTKDCDTGLQSSSITEEVVVQSDRTITKTVAPVFKEGQAVVVGSAIPPKDGIASDAEAPCRLDEKRRFTGGTSGEHPNSIVPNIDGREVTKLHGEISDPTVNAEIPSSSFIDNISAKEFCKTQTNGAEDAEALCKADKLLVAKEQTAEEQPVATDPDPGEHEVTNVYKETSDAVETSGTLDTIATSDAEAKVNCEWDPSEDEVQKMRSKLLKRGGWDAVGLEGGDQFREYMQYKNRKLRDQFSHEAGKTVTRRDKSEDENERVCKEGHRGDVETGGVFRNVVVWVDGRTNPGRLEIRKIVMRYGGQFETYWTSRVTHVVADTLAAATAKRMRSRVAASPSGLKKGSANIKMVTAQWVSQSAQLRKRLPEWQFPIPGVLIPGQKSVSALLAHRHTPWNKESQPEREPAPLKKPSPVKSSVTECTAKRPRLMQKTFTKR